MPKTPVDFVATALANGVLAGVLSTAAQLILWLCFSDDLPGILYRDTRMAAAIILGHEVLQGPDMSWWIWGVASALHFGLSILYAGAIVALTTRSSRSYVRLIIGATSGAAIYAMNMHGFVFLFPWFTASREPITFLAHIVFGIVAAANWSGLLQAERCLR